MNVGLSVSRVGGDAQTKAMKSAAGAIRLELAQFREMEVFTQFSSDLDEATKRQLSYGEGLMALLKQEQYHPYKQYEQVILLAAAMEHIMQDVPARRIREFSLGLLDFCSTEIPDICEDIEKTGRLGDEYRAKIVECSKKYLNSFLNN